MSMIKEFLTFLKNYQVIGLAVAVIIGAAAGKLVSAFVNDIVMPIVGLLMPGGDWRTFSISLTAFDRRHFRRNDRLYNYCSSRLYSR
jgi:large conductance mechanosensitive channel